MKILEKIVRALAPKSEFATARLPYCGTYLEVGYEKLIYSGHQEYQINEVLINGKWLDAESFLSYKAMLKLEEDLKDLLQSA